MEGNLSQSIYRFLENSHPDGSYVVGGVALASATGSVRTQNQDRVAYVEVPAGTLGNRSLRIALLADGMGGMLEGEFAAQIAISAFIEAFLSKTKIPLEKRIEHAISAADRYVYEQLNGRGGTTLVVSILSATEGCWVASVGDSRAYAVHVDGKLVQMTRDDTIGALVVQSKEDTDNRLFQYIGLGGGVEAQIIRMSSSVKHVLMTSDGVHFVGNDVLGRFLSFRIRDREFVISLLRLAEAFGSPDNATAICLDIRDDDFLSDVDDSIKIYCPSSHMEVRCLEVPTSNEVRRVERLQDEYPEYGVVEQLFGEGDVRVSPNHEKKKTKKAKIKKATAAKKKTGVSKTLDIKFTKGE